MQFFTMLTALQLDMMLFIINILINNYVPRWNTHLASHCLVGKSVDAAAQHSGHIEFLVITIFFEYM